MPASTCWQWRATVRALRPATRLGQGRRERRTVVPRRRQRGLGGLDGDEALGQPVAHGLERRRWAARTGCVRGRGPGPARAWPRRPHQLVGQRPLPGGHRGTATGRIGGPTASSRTRRRHLDEAEVGIEALDGAPVEVRRVHHGGHRPVAAADDDRPPSATTPAVPSPPTATLLAATGRAGPRARAAGARRRAVGSTPRGERARGRGPTTWRWRALELEQGRRPPPAGRRRAPPASRGRRARRRAPPR